MPLGVGFFNPDLVEQLQLGPLMQAIGAESAYNNDEEIDNPNSLTFTQLTDIFGVDFGLTEEQRGQRGRLRRHGGRAARRGQRPRRAAAGIDFRRSLGDIIADNTDIPRTELGYDVFFVNSNVPPASCRVQYQVTTSLQGGFQTAITVTNTGSTPIPAGWTLWFVFQNGQRITDDWGAVSTHEQARVPMVNEAWNAARLGGGIGFNATWDNVSNVRPPRFTLDTTQCSVG